MAKKAVRKKVVTKANTAAAEPVTVSAPLEPMEKVDPDAPAPTAAGDSLSLYEIEAELTRAMNDWAAIEEEFNQFSIEHSDKVEQVQTNPHLSDSEKSSLLNALHSYHQDATQDYLSARDVAIEVLEAYTNGSKTKRDNVARYIFSLECKVDNFAVEIRRLQQLKKYADNRVERIKQTVLDSMSVQHTDMLEGNLHSFRRSRTRPTIEIVDENVVPNEYRKPPTVPAPDKTKIYQFLSESSKRVAEMIYKTVGTKPTKEEMGNALETYGKLADKIPGTKLVTNRYHLRVR